MASVLSFTGFHLSLVAFLPADYKRKNLNAEFVQHAVQYLKHCASWGEPAVRRQQSTCTVFVQLLCSKSMMVRRHGMCRCRLSFQLELELSI